MIKTSKSNQSQGYNVDLNTETKFLLSTSGSQSSIERHNKALKVLHLNLVYFTFSQDIIPAAYAGLLRAPIVRGGAVTGRGGLKSTIIPFLDEVEPLAKRTLAVNTVVNNEGKLFGYNTDVFGLKNAILQALKESKIKIKTGVVYGNGGVSGVAFHVLQDLGIRVAMVGRNKEHVLKKKLELGIDKISHFNGPYDLVVDATPISSDPLFLKNAVGFSELIKNCKMVFSHNMPELNGKKNYLEEYCYKQNIQFVPGKKMYVSQLIKQFGFFLEGYTKKDGTSITEKDIADAWKLR